MERDMLTIIPIEFGSEYLASMNLFYDRPTVGRLRDRGTIPTNVLTH